MNFGMTDNGPYPLRGSAPTPLRGVPRKGRPCYTISSLTVSKEHHMISPIEYTAKCLSDFAGNYGFNPCIGNISFEKNGVIEWRIDIEKISENDVRCLELVWQDYQFTIKTSAPSRYGMDGFIETELEVSVEEDDEDTQPIKVKIIFDRLLRPTWRAVQKSFEDES